MHPGRKRCTKRRMGFEMNYTNITRKERGWGGHFIGGNNCYFRRNTLLEREKDSIIISTVGNYYPLLEKGPVMIGAGRYYETMVWYADDSPYKDADINRGEIPFSSPWSISELVDYVDNIANDMHEQVVLEMLQKMNDGEI